MYCHLYIYNTENMKEDEKKNKKIKKKKIQIRKNYLKNQKLLFSIFHFRSTL